MKPSLMVPYDKYCSTYHTRAFIRKNQFEEKSVTVEKLTEQAQGFLFNELVLERWENSPWVLSAIFNNFEQATLLFERWESLKWYHSNHSVEISTFRSDKGMYSIWTDPEKRIQDKLYKKLGGKKEVRTPLGDIDLLTDTDVIEIKLFKNWKGALGQLIVYSSFYPQHRKRLYLFDRQIPTKLEIIRFACAQYDILLDFELDEGYRHEY